MKIHDVPQRSYEWADLRAGIPTASEFSNLVTPKKWAVKKGGAVDTYLAYKLAEMWQGGALSGTATFDMDQGNILEEEAIPWFSFEFDEPVQKVGFITSDDGKVGCSPDGLITDGGLEIKCPTPEVHCRHLLADDLPPQYAAQVHGGMYVTGRSYWKFVSYRRRFPPLVVTVFRDEKIIEVIDEAVQLFSARLERAFQRLCERNGGPPPKQERYKPDPYESPPELDLSKDDVGIIP